MVSAGGGTSKASDGSNNRLATRALCSSRSFLRFSILRRTLIGKAIQVEILIMGATIA